MASSSSLHGPRTCGCSKVPETGERLELVEVHGSNVPRYATLSHTWTEDEVLYEHVIHGTACERGAFRKVIDTLALARQDDIPFVWMDTCCINKDSSAELQEAINSMYSWYRDCQMCYAYLEDVSDCFKEQRFGLVYDEFDQNFENSRWFTRGWTLQELLAPDCVHFYSSDWEYLGTIPETARRYLGSNRMNLIQDQVSRITGIDMAYLGRHHHVDTASVAKRMSWASRRQTTREEDLAYCLLGIFDVNMPLLYGEGSKSFSRLQEEIMKQSSDHSLFLWTSTNPIAHGIIAPSPAQFEHTGGDLTARDDISQPFAMTNIGLQIQLPLMLIADEIYLAKLNYSHGVFLRRIPEVPNTFVRILHKYLGQFPNNLDNVTWETIRIMQQKGSARRRRGNTPRADPLMARYCAPSVIFTEIEFTGSTEANFEPIATYIGTEESNFKKQAVSNWRDVTSNHGTAYNLAVGRVAFLIRHVTLGRLLLITLSELDGQCPGIAVSLVPESENEGKGLGHLSADNLSVPHKTIRVPLDWNPYFGYWVLPLLTSARDGSEKGGANGLSAKHFQLLLSIEYKSLDYE